MGLTVAPTANAKTGLTREAQGARESLSPFRPYLSQAPVMVSKILA